jgi:hypothetical protein
MTYDDYVKATEKLWSTHKKKLSEAKKKRDDCVKKCEQHADFVKRQLCKDACDEDFEAFKDAEWKDYGELTLELGLKATSAGLLQPPLIVADGQFTDLAMSLHVGDFAKAPIELVTTAQALEKILASNREVTALMLVLRARLGQIELGGQLVSLTSLASGAKFRVSDYVDLRGPSDGTQPAGADALRTAVHAGQLQQHWTSVTVEVASSDKRTAKIPSVLVPEGVDHFVTVKGSKAVTLRATPSPDTPKNRKDLKWISDDGKTLETGAIAHFDRDASRMQVVRVGFGPTMRTIIVWVVWAELKSEVVGPSKIDKLTLAATSWWTPASATKPGIYAAAGRIDWLAEITPKNIIVDPDRPAISDQPPVAPPGEGAYPPKGFEGWQVAVQERAKTYRGKVGSSAFSKDESGWGPSGGGSRLRTPTSPYHGPSPFGGNLRWIEELADNVGVAGNYERGRKNARAFVRVQLGATWYVCSDKASVNALGRWHYFAQRDAARWSHEPGLEHIDVVDGTNDAFDGPNH